MTQPLIHTIPPDPSIAPLDSSMSRNLIPKNTAIIILMTVLLLGISTGGVVAYLSSSSSVISNKPQMIDSSGSNPQSAGVLDKTSEKVGWFMDVGYIEIL